MMTEKEIKKLEAELKRLQEEELLLTGKNVVKESVEEQKPKKPLTLEDIQKKQNLLQMQVARIRRKKGKRVVTESSAEISTKDFDVDLVECVKRIKNWDSVINYHLYEAVDSEAVIPGQEQMQDVISTQQNQLQGDISSGAEGVEQEKQENTEGTEEENEVSTEKATLNDLVDELKALNKTILQLIQFKDSVLPDELQDVDNQQSKLQKRVDDFQEYQDKPEGEEANTQQQNPEQQVRPEDIQEAIDRRNAWKELAEKLVAIDEKYNGDDSKKKVNEATKEEEAKEQAISRITEPDDDVKKQLQDLHNKIGDMIQQSFEKKPMNQDSFLPPTPVTVVSSSGATAGAVVGDVAVSEPEKTDNAEVVVPNTENQLNAQRKQILMQQQTIKKLQSQLGTTK